MPAPAALHEKPAGTLIEIPYAPRILQQKLHVERSRFLVLVTHRRWGKTIWAVNELIKSAFACKLQDPRVAYIAPQLKQAKRICWDYVLRFTRKLPERYVNRAELVIEWPVGPDSVARFSLLGADDPDNLRGAYLDDVALDEYEKMNPRTWGEVIRPMLTDRIGGAVFTGTPFGMNHFRKLYDDAALPVNTDNGWSRYLYKASETGIVAQVELDSARREMSEAQYQQEFECSWTAAIPGAYYAVLMDTADKEGRITDVPKNPNYPVEAWFDLGLRDATAIWVVQRIGGKVHVLHSMEVTGMSLPDIISMVRNLPFQPITRWIAPHDIEVRDYSTSGTPTRREVARNFGVEFEVAAKLPIPEGVDMVRRLLPTCVFDRKGTQDGRNALMSYRSKYDGKNDVLKVVPVDDWSSHYADSFRTGAVAGPGFGSLLESVDWGKFYGACGGYAA